MIRSYKPSDFDMICKWWTDQNECPPLQGMMIPDGTFILEKNKVPALSLTVFLTQSKEIAYLEGFIKNPEFKESLEKEAHTLWQHCFDYAKFYGYTRVICYCMQEKLKQKYVRLGMTLSGNNLTSFVRSL